MFLFFRSFSVLNDVLDMISHKKKILWTLAQLLHVLKLSLDNTWKKTLYRSLYNYFFHTKKINIRCSYFSFFPNLSRQCSYDVLKFRSNLSIDVLIKHVLIKKHVTVDVEIPIVTFIRNFELQVDFCRFIDSTKRK